jgi:hypothetical protein
MNISSKLLENPTFRRAIGKLSVYYFAVVYFPQLFKFPTPDFHRKWYHLLNFKDPENKQTFNYLILCAFRDSAKTSLAKIKVVRDICYKRRSLIGYVCYEKEASAEALFDIVMWLTTNKKIIRDFGNLFHGDNLDKRPEKKSIGNFVTTNGVRVTSYGIRQSVRGKTFDLERPDCYVIDDFENNITKESAALTKKAISFIKELLTGLSVGAEIIFVCNKISDTGSVQWLLDTANNNPQFRVEEVPIIEKGKCIWPERYALTDKEAFEINSKIKNPKRHLKSLETEKRTMNADGKPLFEQEMLLQPIVEGDRFFDIKKVDQRISYLQGVKWQDKLISAKNYQNISDDWMVWRKANKNSRYGIAADVSEGVGNDSSVIEIYDFTNNRHVAEYESDSCPPSVLAKMLGDRGKECGFCVVAPERNSVGVSVIELLKLWDERGYPNMYRERTIDKVSNTPIHRFGWHTNSKTRPHMLFEFKKDFEQGLIEINSIPLLREMRAFTKKDIAHKASSDPLTSNHFDRVIAFAILWQMRNVIQIKGFKT